VCLVPYLYFIAANSAVIEGTLNAGRLADRGEAAQRLSSVVAAASLRLPVDSALSPGEAGGILSALIAGEPGGRSWEGARPRQETIPGSLLVGGPLPSPHSLAPRQVMLVALGTPTEPEVAYLRGFGGDPRFPHFERLARAASYDPGIPVGYPPDLLFSERAGAGPLLPVQEVAFHKLAFAGYQAATGDLPAAERSLREIFSVGYLLATESNELAVAMLGRNLAVLAQGALGEVTLARGGRADDPFLRPGAPHPARQMEPMPPAWRRQSRQEWLARSLVLAGDPMTPRAVRLEVLGALVPASACMSIDGILLGPGSEIHEVVDKARADLVRYPSDKAYLDAAAQTMERVGHRIAAEPLDPPGGVIVRLAARVYRNPRFLTCAVAMGMQ